MIQFPKFPVDYFRNDDPDAIRSLEDTAVEMLSDLDSGLDRGESPSERIERLERMVCLKILRDI